MSVVLKFPLEKVSRTSSLRFEERHLTKVLVFEGVRYSRTKSEEAQPENQAPSNKILEAGKPSK